MGVDLLNVKGLQALDPSAPVVMVNLMRFRERSLDGDGSGWDAYLRYSALTKAVHEGARYASAFALNGSTGVVEVNAQLVNEVRNVVVYGNQGGTGGIVLGGLQPAQVTVVDLGGDWVRVDASYPYQPIIGPVLPNLGLGSSITTSFVMQASVTMRAL